jgi:hypothetical protein
MVSPVLQQAILNLRGPDIVGAFERGREQSRQRQVRELAGQTLRGEPGAIDELAGVDPEIAFSIAERIGARDAQSVNNFIRDAGIGRRMLEGGNTQGFVDFARNRISVIQAQGGNTQQTESILNRVLAGDTGGAIQELRAFDSAIEDAKRSSQRAFAPIEVVDPQGRRALGVPTFDPATGQAGFERVPLGEAELARETAAEKREAEVKAAGQRALATEQRKQSIKISGDTFDKIANIRKSILNIDDAIEAIDKGAKTGAIEKFLPSIRASSVELDNIAGRMGLDIVGATTFGALSESELKFALDTALPRGLNEDELRAWLVDKKQAQNKLRDELQKTAVFLNRGGTIGELLEQQSPQDVSPQQGLGDGGSGIRIISIE